MSRGTCQRDRECLQTPEKSEKKKSNDTYVSKQSPEQIIYMQLLCHLCDTVLCANIFECIRSFPKLWSRRRCRFYHTKANHTHTHTRPSLLRLCIVQSLSSIHRTSIYAHCRQLLLLLSFRIFLSFFIIIILFVCGVVYIVSVSVLIINLRYRNETVNCLTSSSEWFACVFAVAMRCMYELGECFTIHMHVVATVVSIYDMIVIYACVRIQYSHSVCRSVGRSFYCPCSFSVLSLFHSGFLLHPLSLLAGVTAAAVSLPLLLK